MRTPEEIGLKAIQETAYYVSFLKRLDEEGKNLNDFEKSFIESNLNKKTVFSGPQKRALANMMDKHSKIYPRFSEYNTLEAASEFLGI